MGAWGTGSFDNDTACDWAQDLEGTEDYSLIERTLRSVAEVETDTYLDADLACCGIAAAETLARRLGGEGKKSAHTEIVDRWVERREQEPPPELINLAAAVLRRIVSPQSELLELWEDEGAGEEWMGSIETLLGRLSRPNKARR